MHLYRNGFNKITVKDVDSNSLKEIKRVISNLLLGFEITSNSDNKCIIENISEPSEDKYEFILRKIFFSIKDSFDLIIKRFDEFQEIYSELEEIKDNNIKMILFCRRTLMKDKYSKNVMLNWEFLTFLSHIQKNIYYTYKYVHENKIKKDKSMIESIEKSKEHFILLENAFYEKDSSYLEKLQKSSVKYAYKDILDLISKANGKKAVFFAYVKELLRLIKTAGSPVRSMLIK